jgi:hypothetical protein
MHNYFVAVFVRIGNLQWAIGKAGMQDAQLFCSSSRGEFAVGSWQFAMASLNIICILI